MKPTVIITDPKLLHEHIMRRHKNGPHVTREEARRSILIQNGKLSPNQR